MYPNPSFFSVLFSCLPRPYFHLYIVYFPIQQGRAKDNDTPFSVRDTPEGIRVLIGDETKNDSQWDGVLDLSWGVEPRPFFRVDRIDVNEGVMQAVVIVLVVAKMFVVGWYVVVLFLWKRQMGRSWDGSDDGGEGDDDKHL